MGGGGSFTRARRNKRGTLSTAQLRRTAKAAVETCSALFILAVTVRVGFRPRAMPFARAPSAAILQPLSSQRTAGPSRPHTASARSLRFKPREGPVPTCQHPPREQRQAAPYRSLGLPDPSRSLLADFSWRLPRHVESACSLTSVPQLATAAHHPAAFAVPLLSLL